MNKNLQSYQRALTEAEAELKRKLANGRTTASDIAVVRRTWELMVSQLHTSPDSVLMYERLPADPQTGLNGADRWHLDVYRQANNEIFPHLVNDKVSTAYNLKQQEYLELGLRIVQSPDMRYRSVVDRKRGKSYLYKENPLVPRIMQVVAQELIRWFNEYPADREFYRRGWYLTWRAEAGLGLFLQERPDMVALLLFVQLLPLDTEVSEVPIDRPAVVEALELAIGLIPVVGSIVAAYEAYSGEDLFGYHLTDLECGILAASILLPLAGRVVKGGRVIYSEARMISMYGRDAVSWSRTIRAGGQATARASSLRILEEAETSIRTHRGLDRILAQKAAIELPKVVRTSAPVSSVVDQVVTDLFRNLSSKHNILRGLDELALQRVLNKGPNINHLKGQLLEELIEARVVPWLRERAGSLALGIQTGGKQIEFIPGHLIRDVNGRQITDGILAYRKNGILEIVAIFEAKAGRKAARELSLSTGSISSLSKSERMELRAYAWDVLKEQQAAAREANMSFTKTLEEIEREVALSELGGQVRRDIERLTANVDGPLAQIRLGSDLIPVRISPTNTKFFGVLPKDVDRSLIERELREAKFSFEIIGVDISQRNLESISREMVPLAKNIIDKL